MAEREFALAANAGMVRRTRLDIETLTTLFAAIVRADTVDGWQTEKGVALNQQAARRRDELRRLGRSGGAGRDDANGRCCPAPCGRRIRCRDDQ